MPSEYFHPLCPPFMTSSFDDTLDTHVREIEHFSNYFDVVTVMVYDIMEEPSRTDPSDIITPRPRHETTDYMRCLQRNVNIRLRLRLRLRWMLFHAIRREDTLETIHQWYVDTMDVFDSVVMVGNHWNPLKVDVIYPYLRAVQTQRPKPKQFGAVLIPHRLGEKERCQSRRCQGVDFFISQLQLYPTQEWQDFSREFSLITLTTIPSSDRQLTFLKNLGVLTEGYKDIHETIPVKIARCMSFVKETLFGFEILSENPVTRQQYIDNLLSYLMSQSVEK